MEKVGVGSRSSPGWDPLIGLLLSSLLAVLAMSLNSLTVISNANRLKLWKPEEVV